MAILYGCQVNTITGQPVCGLNGTGRDLKFHLRLGIQREHHKPFTKSRITYGGNIGFYGGYYIDTVWRNESAIQPSSESTDTYNLKNNWIHVTITVHNEGGVDRNTIYFNGEKVSEYKDVNESINYSGEGDQIFENMVIMLGGYGDSKNGIPHATTWSRDAFNGRMYDLRIFDRTITAQEAKAVYDGNTAYDESMRVLVPENGTKVWMDFSDVGSLTKDSSNKVSSVRNKISGGASLDMSSSTYKPMYSASAFDGKGGLQFDEAQYMEFSDLNLISKDSDFTGMTVFIVARADRDENYAYLSKNTRLYNGVSNKYGNYNSLILGYWSGMSVQVSVEPLGTSGTIYNNIYATKGRNQDPHLVAWTLSKDSSTELTSKMHVNGSLVFDQTNTYTSSQLNSFDFTEGQTEKKWAIGQEWDTNPSDYFDGDMAEIIIVDGVLTDEQIQAVSHYLKEKWKLEPRWDSDGDGYIDSLETLHGSLPNNASSTPNVVADIPENAPQYSNATVWLDASNIDGNNNQTLTAEKELLGRKISYLDQELRNGLMYQRMVTMQLQPVLQPQPM